MRVLGAFKDGSDEWLELRKKGIGSSDAAAILNVEGAFRTPLQVWADKRGIAMENDDPEWKRELFWFGHEMEPVIAKKLAEVTGWKIEDETRTFAHDDYPFIMANIDRWATDETGSRGVAELKNVSSHRSDLWQGGAPVAYRVQLQHQLAVTGAQWGAIAAVIGGNSFVHYRYERNEGFIEALIDECQKFWDMVQNDIMPDPTGRDSYVLNALVKEDKKAEPVVLGADFILLDEQRQSLSAQISELKKKVDEIEAKIKKEIGASSVGILPNGVRYTWFESMRGGYSVPASKVRKLNRKGESK